VVQLRGLWWVLVGVGAAGAVALSTTVYLLDATPSHLLCAALPAYGIVLGVARSRLKVRTDSDTGLPSSVRGPSRRDRGGKDDATAVPATAQPTKTTDEF
jgi:hypothetical protein